MESPIIYCRSVLVGQAHARARARSCLRYMHQKLCLNLPVSGSNNDDVHMLLHEHNATDGIQYMFDVSCWQKAAAEFGLRQWLHRTHYLCHYTDPVSESRTSIRMEAWPHTPMLMIAMAFFLRYLFSACTFLLDLPWSVFFTFI